MDKKQRLYFSIAGALSAITFPLIMIFGKIIGDQGNYFVSYLLFMAGIPYGITTGLYLKRTFNMRISKLLGWIIGTSVSYLCAALYVFSNGNEFLVPLLHSAIGGLIGASILIVAFRLFVAHVSVDTCMRVCAASMIIISVWNMLIGLFDIKFLVFLFLFWQFVISYILARSLITIQPASPFSIPSTPTQSL